MFSSNKGSAKSLRRRLLESAAAPIFASVFIIGAVTLSGLEPAAAGPVQIEDLTSQPAPSFAKLIERVRPAVVSVKVMIEEASKASDESPVAQEAESGPIIGLGSGFFVSADGYVATNDHVVQHARTVTVTMEDGETLPAHVVGADPGTDLAVIKVDKPGDYPFVSFAKEPAQVGDWVVAIGNPFGLGGTATAGIVSAKGRNIGDGPYDRFLQIDAPINKGNSGGPTFNLRGEVVGINTAIFSPSGGSVGVGFAIPASTAQRVVDALEHGGAISRGFLGVTVQPVTETIADALGLKTAAGALVDSVTPATPAAEAGLMPGDVILRLNGEPVKDSADLTLHVGQLKPGEKAQLTYSRERAEKTVTVALASQKPQTVAKEEAPVEKRAPTLGIEIAPAKDIPDAGEKGVVIVGIDPNGAAAASGLSKGDVILQVAGKPVSTPAEIKTDLAADRKEGKKAVLLRVHSAEGDHFVAIPLTS